LRDDSDSRLQEIREQEVVKADQSNTMMKAHASQHAKCADRYEVLPGEKRGGGVGSGEQLRRRRLRLLDSAQVESDQMLVDLQVVVCKRFEVSLMPLGGGCDRMQVAEISDPTVAMCDEMRDASPNAGSVSTASKPDICEGNADRSFSRSALAAR